MFTSPPAAPTLTREELEALQAALQASLSYFDAAMMCGNDLSELAEPVRHALSLLTRALEPK